MKNKIEYSFDDEYITKFCYDLENKKIQLHFNAYYDLKNNNRILRSSVWNIEDWTSAKSKVSTESRYTDLNKNLGILFLILYMELNNNKLEITVCTIDDRYIDLIFENPKIYLK